MLEAINILGSYMLSIKPISINEWMPDRCLSTIEPIIPEKMDLRSGCPSLGKYTNGERGKLVSLYKNEIDEYGCCGFVAWKNERVLGYISFFSLKTANRTRFYGYGEGNMNDQLKDIFIHNCISIWKRSSGKGIGTKLVNQVIKYGEEKKWNEYRVNNVLPDCEKGWGNHQKGCLSFWLKNGFTVTNEIEAEKEIQSYYHVRRKYTLSYIYE